MTPHGHSQKILYNAFPLLRIAVKYSKVEENKNNTEEKNKEERLLDRDEHRKGGLLGRKVAVSPESVLHNTQTTSHCILESQTALHYSQTNMGTATTLLYYLVV